MPEYGKKFLAHFLNPEHVGAVDDPDGFGEAGNPACEDRVRVSLRIGDGRIREARFLARGCATTIASSSITMKNVTGMAVEEASKVTAETIIRWLGKVPERKRPCASAVANALHAALLGYKERKKGHGSIAAAKKE
jgi:nitrogen fixation NifU-like protein